MRGNDYLFRGVDSFSVQRQQTERMQSEVAGMDANRLLNTNVDDLVGYFAERHGIEVPALIEGEMVVDQREAQRDVSGDPMRRFFYDRHQGPIMVTGTEILLEVPFSGDPQIFRVQPSTYNMNPPQGIVQGNILTTTLWGDNLNADQVRGQINTWLGEVRQHLQWQRDSFRNFNVALAQQARDGVVRRRDQLLRNQNLVASLGIPLKRRPDAPATYVAPEVRRKLAPQLPPATAGAFKPEPAMEEAEYQHILGVMENMAHVLERSPKVFYNLDEESLRTHFLVQLNGHSPAGRGRPDHPIPGSLGGATDRAAPSLATDEDPATPLPISVALIDPKPLTRRSIEDLFAKAFREYAMVAASTTFTGRSSTDASSV
jgi:hypothetical protein